jgi:endonuclease G
MSFWYLSDREIGELVGTASELGLADPGQRAALLAPFNRQFVGSLQPAGNAVGQLSMDLHRLNRIERLEDGTVPLKVWLNQALLLTGHEVQAQLFRRFLAELEAPPPPPLGRHCWDPPAELPECAEAVVIADQRVPADFLECGRLATASVACVRVPRYVSGKPSGYRGAQREAIGTGWVIAPQLLITSYSVASAREEGEDAVEDADLLRQVQSATVRFDLEGQHRRSRSGPAIIRVIGLEAQDPALDYAIFRLQRDPHVPALRLARHPFVVEAGSFPPLNLIEDPGDGQKVLAIRSNLATSSVGNDLRYFSLADPRTLGAPVFDDMWNVVALHRGTTRTARKVANFEGRLTAFINVATLIYPIREHLQSKYSGLWEEIADAYTKRLRSRAVADSNVINFETAQSGRGGDARTVDLKPLRDRTKQAAEAVASLATAVSAGRADLSTPRLRLRSLLTNTKRLLRELAGQLDAGLTNTEGSTGELEESICGCERSMDALLARSEALQGGLAPADRTYQRSRLDSDSQAVQKALAEVTARFEARLRMAPNRHLPE